MRPQIYQHYFVLTSGSPATMATSRWMILRPFLSPWHPRLVPRLLAPSKKIFVLRAVFTWAHSWENLQWNLGESSQIWIEWRVKIWKPSTCFTSLLKFLSNIEIPIQEEKWKFLNPCCGNIDTTLVFVCTTGVAKINSMWRRLKLSVIFCKFIKCAQITNYNIRHQNKEKLLN